MLTNSSSAATTVDINAADKDDVTPRRICELGR